MVLWSVAQYGQGEQGHAKIPTPAANRRRRGGDGHYINSHGIHASLVASPMPRRVGLGRIRPDRIGPDPIGEMLAMEGMDRPHYMAGL